MLAIVRASTHEQGE